MVTLKVGKDSDPK